MAAKILLVEDSETQLKFLKESLIQNGFETVIDIDTYEDAQLFYQTQGD